MGDIWYVRKRAETQIGGRKGNGGEKECDKIKEDKARYVYTWL